MEIRQYRNGTRRLAYSSRELRIPRHIVAQLHETVIAWHSIFPREETFASAHYGTPSLMVRFDGVLSPDGSSFRTYEIQDGPGGVGYAGIVSEHFRAVRDSFAKDKWLPFSFFGSTLTREHDDRLWLPRVFTAQALATDVLLSLRSRLTTFPEHERTYLIRRSVIPVDAHGDKRYGVELGWWKEIMWDGGKGAESLPWQDRFALKPVIGTGARDVHVWGVKGHSTRAQILRAFQKRGTMFFQEYIPPMSLEIDGIAYSVILRPFFAYDPQRKTWTPMHGTWVARPSPNARVHGASDAINGPLYMES